MVQEFVVVLDYTTFDFGAVWALEVASERGCSFLVINVLTHLIITIIAPKGANAVNKRY